MTPRWSAAPAGCSVRDGAAAGRGSSAPVSACPQRLSGRWAAATAVAWLASRLGRGASRRVLWPPPLSWSSPCRAAH
eukprot:scaffold24893_cov27-Tisochrysis_lutea.AAC.5